ncbi:tRNA pseudouridine(38-40) synthase [Bacteriovorax sp. BAL6_X]|uniref:tRNA pseudouridine(38-40) synthase TruA n=1 Tax=Bacteriovorax sp. BAL6_X TaxID=1201290 RepID=UPI00038672BD|nr:tRNA pseudouridine(38-40) synthase TruA [Bacteriovorax sp. BAL6_X]EPZ49482.1 tRNA pseudouridine(38-40) synthase [Bacteriovorax sp. BAL6_X]
MSIYKVTFSYDGTDYFGWQKQIGQQSIQGEIEKVLKQLSKSDDIQVVGCGRTDTGVHAISQVTRVTLPIEIDPKALMRALNSQLPEAIKVLDSEYAPDDFQPVFNAESKTYRYVFSIKKQPNPYLRNYVTYLGNDLELDKLNEACQLFIGEHDFEGFSTKGTPVKSTIRKVTSCYVFESEMSYGPGLKENVFIMEITGNGFLKQMVRLIVSSIWSYAQGKISREVIVGQLTTPSVKKVAPTAPPQGLFLVKVEY